MHRIGMVNPYPDINNAETEVIRRIFDAAKSVGVECILLDPAGFILNTNDHVSEKYGQDDISFVLSLHHTSPKVTDYFTYYTAWNPPEFFGFSWNYEATTACVATCDDVLTYGSAGIDNHLRSFLNPIGFDIDNSLFFSISAASPYFPPDREILENARLFYCGINWEKVGAKHGRHHELFKLLDAHEDVVSFFGPRMIAGVAPWGDYRCYRGEIPFDGHSIVEEIHNCGIALAITSKAHLEASAVTSRIFEGTAAGAYIIADENPYIEAHFGDSVRYVDMSEGNSERIAHDILDIVKWVKNNSAEAAEMATRAQNIYLEKFAYEGQIQRLITAHENRQRARCRVDQIDLTAIVVYDKRVGDMGDLSRTLQTIGRQKVKPKSVILVCDNDDHEHVKNSVIDADIDIISVDMKLINKNYYFDDKSASTGTVVSSVLDKVVSRYVSVLICGHNWTNMQLEHVAKHLNQNADVILGGYRQNRSMPRCDGDQYHKGNVPYFHMSTLTVKELREVFVEFCIFPALASMAIKVEFLRSISNIDLMDGDWLGTLVLAHAIVDDRLAFTGRLAASKSEKIREWEVKYPDKYRQWQLYHLSDSFRGTSKWNVYIHNISAIFGDTDRNAAEVKFKELRDKISNIESWSSNVSRWIDGTEARIHKHASEMPNFDAWFLNVIRLIGGTRNSLLFKIGFKFMILTATGVSYTRVIFGKLLRVFVKKR